MDLNPADKKTTPQEEEQTTTTPVEQDSAVETTVEDVETPATPEETPEEAPEATVSTEEETQPSEPTDTPAADAPTESSADESVLEEESSEESDDTEEDEDTEEQQDESDDEDDEEEKPRQDLSRLEGEELYHAIDEMVGAGTVPSQRDMRRLERQMMPRNSRPSAAATETPEESSDDEGVVRFINLKTRVQKLRNDLREQEKTEREENLAAKRELVHRLNDLLSPTNTMNSITLRNEFFNIRHAWSTIGRVPDNDRNALMDEYSALLDRFYEEKEIGEGERIQDYADNRAAKEEIIRKAKALAEDEKTDAVRAFRKMKSLLDEWKEVGPVAPEFKDSLHKDFKDAQQVVYKRHDDHFKAIHEDEKINYQKKLELVDHLEKMLVTLPTNRQGWRKYEREMRHIQNQWRSIGRVPKDQFMELRGRYNLARDEFYMQRKSFLKDLSAEITPKLERLRELADEAEELQYSEEWSATTEKLKTMQREWTENSRFGTQVAEAQRLWKRFRSACDTFFQRKAELHKQRDADRQDNLQAKYDVVDRLEALLDRRNDPDILDEVKKLEEEWKSIGPVPNDEKDDVLNRYYGTMRILTGQGGRRGSGGRRDGGRDRRRNGGDNRRGDREPKFAKVNLQKDLSKLSKDDLKDEQMNVKHGISKLEDELLQLETNFGFFSGDPDSPMVQHVQKQIDEVKEKIARYQSRVGEIKEEAKKPEEVSPSKEVETTAAEPIVEEPTVEETPTTDTPAEE